jgi:hypothetical protein
MFGGKPGMCCFYKQGEEKTFPADCDKAVEACGYFDRLGVAEEAPAEVSFEDALTHKDVDHSPDNPLDTLGLTKLQIEGLAQENIKTVSDLRSCLKTEEGYQKLLKSEHIRAGEKTLDVWKEKVFGKPKPELEQDEDKA